MHFVKMLVNVKGSWIRKRSKLKDTPTIIATEHDFLMSDKWSNKILVWGQ